MKVKAHATQSVQYEIVLILTTEELMELRDLMQNKWADAETELVCKFRERMFSAANALLAGTAPHAIND